MNFISVVAQNFSYRQIKYIQVQNYLTVAVWNGFKIIYELLFEVILLINDIRLVRSKSEYTGKFSESTKHAFKIRQKMSRTVTVNAGKWIWVGHLPVGKSFAKKILEHWRSRQAFEWDT